jgi:Predicted oxidoreductases (related to aryl-alcohol dehydrogenases)
MLYNILGKTQFKVSAVAFGGIVVKDESPANAAGWVAEAVDSGVNYFDVAPGYGNAQEILGPALEPYRKNVYLACKTGRRDAQGAREELADSLRKLKTDYFDVYQLHGLASMEELDASFAPGGAIEVFIEAKKAGVVRNLGFSAHSEEVALTALERFPFDTVLFPMNWAMGCVNGWGDRIAAKREELGIGLLAIKTLVRRKWREGEVRDYPKSWCKPILSGSDNVDINLAVAGMKYGLAKGASILVPPGDIKNLRFMLKHIDLCDAPLTSSELTLLRTEADKVRDELIF